MLERDVSPEGKTVKTKGIPIGVKKGVTSLLKRRIDQHPKKGRLEKDRVGRKYLLSRGGSSFHHKGARLFGGPTANRKGGNSGGNSNGEKFIGGIFLKRSEEVTHPSARERGANSYGKKSIDYLAKLIKEGGSCRNHQKGGDQGSLNRKKLQGRKRANKRRGRNWRHRKENLRVTPAKKKKVRDSKGTGSVEEGPNDFH